MAAHSPFASAGSLKRKRESELLSTDFKPGPDKRVLTDRLISPLRPGPPPRLLKVTRLHQLPLKSDSFAEEALQEQIAPQDSQSRLRPPQVHRSLSAHSPFVGHSLHSTGFNFESPAKPQEFKVDVEGQTRSPFSHSNTSVLNYRIFKSPPRVVASDRTNSNLGA